MSTKKRKKGSKLAAGLAIGAAAGTAAFLLKTKKGKKVQKTIVKKAKALEKELKGVKVDPNMLESAKKALEKTSKKAGNFLSSLRKASEQKQAAPKKRSAKKSSKKPATKKKK